MLLKDKPLRTKPIKEKSFADEVRAFFGMSVKKPIDVSKQDPQKTVDDLRETDGRIPRQEIKPKAKKKK